MSSSASSSVAARAESRRRRGGFALALVFGALLLVHVSFRNEFERFRQPNAMSRVYLALALAEQGRFSVDGQVARYGPVEDLARHDGRLYSDKPPGSALWMAPAALLLRQTLLPASPDPMGLLVALRLLCVSLPALLFWFFTRSVWYEFAGSARRGLAVLVAGSAGSIFLVYATGIWPHVQAAILAFAAFLAIRSAARIDPSDRRGATLRIALAGLCLGLALLTDLILFLAVPVLATYGLACRPEGWRLRLLALAIGLLPPLAFLAYYNDACFGGPFEFGARHLVDAGYRASYERGFLGMQVPDLRGLLGITLMPSHGLFYLSPVLLLAPLGFWRERRRPEMRAAVATVLAIVLFATMTVDWTGGWGTGCRYLVPAIPFLLLGVAAAVREAPAASLRSVAFRGLTCVGLVTTSLAAASFPLVPPVFPSPIWQVALPLLASGHSMPGLLGGDDAMSTLLPFAAAVTALAWFVLARSWPRDQPRSGRSILAAAALALAVLLTMWLAAPRAMGADQQRAIGLILHIVDG